jgi:ElaB/YqjD/DUF883 family membrane-anchored ribosome-binding protein
MNFKNLLVVAAFTLFLAACGEKKVEETVETPVVEEVAPVVEAAAEVVDSAATQVVEEAKEVKTEVKKAVTKKAAEGEDEGC